MTAVELLQSQLGSLAHCISIYEKAIDMPFYKKELDRCLEEQGEISAALEKLVGGADWKQRVIIEKTDLDDKLGRLTKFFDTDGAADKMEAIDLQLLAAQYASMKDYSEILGRRIERFTTN